VTQKGQGRDPLCDAHSLENGWGYTLGDNEAPIGNGLATWESNGRETDDIT